jgi:nucleoside-triphosphatase THEP1
MQVKSSPSLRPTENRPRFDILALLFYLGCMILILVGPVGSGKTTLLKRVVAGLKEQDVRFTGYLSERVMDGQKTRGYDLVNIRDGKALPFLRREGGEGWPRAGSFFFVPDGIQAAWDIIRHTRAGELLIVDEVGPEELDGGGIWPALKNVLFMPSFWGLCAVRETILDDFRIILGNRPLRVFDVRDSSAYQSIIDAVLRPS